MDRVRAGARRRQRRRGAQHQRAIVGFALVAGSTSDGTSHAFRDGIVVVRATRPDAASSTLDGTLTFLPADGRNPAVAAVTFWAPGPVGVAWSPRQTGDHVRDRASRTLRTNHSSSATAFGDGNQGSSWLAHMASGGTPTRHH